MARAFQKRARSPSEAICIIRFMLGLFGKSARQRRAIDYLKRHPEDEPAVKAIIAAVEILHQNDPREAASSAFGRWLTEEEWAAVRPKWERAWYFIVGKR